MNNDKNLLKILREELLKECKELTREAVESKISVAERQGIAAAALALCHLGFIIDHVESKLKNNQ